MCACFFLRGGGKKRFHKLCFVHQYLSDLDDLHGEDALSRARRTLLGVGVDPLRCAGFWHAVEEAPLRPVTAKTKTKTKTWET